MTALLATTHQALRTMSMTERLRAEVVAGAEHDVFFIEQHVAHLLRRPDHEVAAVRERLNDATRVIAARVRRSIAAEGYRHER